MAIAEDLRFAFDVQGYLHLRGVLTEDELTDYHGWIEAAQTVDVTQLNADYPAGVKQQLNRPLSRFVDADPRFAHFLDHPAVVPFLVEFLGEDYRHIDNDLYFTYPGYVGGKWHRGVSPHPTGHVVDGEFRCPMVKVFYCMNDVGPGQGEFVVIPGSHKAQFKLDWAGRIDLPAQHVFDDVKAGDVIIFNEALIHNGRPNPSQHTRKTVIVNFGRKQAGVWPGYRPKPATLSTVSANQARILSNENPNLWKESEAVA